MGWGSFSLALTVTASVAPTISCRRAARLMQWLLSHVWDKLTLAPADRKVVPTFPASQSGAKKGWDAGN